MQLRAIGWQNKNHVPADQNRLPAPKTQELRRPLEFRRQVAVDLKADADLNENRVGPGHVFPLLGVAVELQPCASPTTCVEPIALPWFNVKLSGRRNVPPEHWQIRIWRARNFRPYASSQ
jgi:hypothetical protein